MGRARPVPSRKRPKTGPQGTHAFPTVEPGIFATTDQWQRDSGR
jgi:hypothetical protein